MKARVTTKQKLEALRRGVELPVDPRNMSMDVGEVPPTDERAVLQLAHVIHRTESRSWVTSWSALERAAAYFNEHGLSRTLTEMFRLEALVLPQEPDKETKDPR